MIEQINITVSETEDVVNVAVTTAENVTIDITEIADSVSVNVTEAEKGPQGPAGPQGIQGVQGEPGPNEATTDTDTNIVGIIKGAAGKLAQALSGTDFQDPIGYTPENVANKENVTLDNSTTKYPTNNLAKTYMDGFLSSVSHDNTLTGAGTAADPLKSAQNMIRITNIPVDYHADDDPLSTRGWIFDPPDNSNRTWIFYLPDIDGENGIDNHNRVIDLYNSGLFNGSQGLWVFVLNVPGGGSRLLLPGAYNTQSNFYLPPGASCTMRSMFCSYKNKWIWMFSQANFPVVPT